MEENKVVYIWSHSGKKEKEDVYTVLYRLYRVYREKRLKPFNRFLSNGLAYVVPRSIPTLAPSNAMVYRVVY